VSATREGRCGSRSACCYGLLSLAPICRKLSALVRKYHQQFKVVFDAIRELMTPPAPGRRRRIGFSPRSKGLSPPRLRQTKARGQINRSKGLSAAATCG